eukprot:5274647-Alexandrium_andersonii.AAC.1
MHLEPITPSQIVKVMRDSPLSAKGPDMWAMEDLKHITHEAAAYLAMMFQAIERGCGWPEQLLIGRALYLGKGQNDTGCPCNYRVLSILSHVYRKWAVLRLKALESWIAGWAEDGMFAGVKGKAADVASYELALRLERAKATGQPMSAMAIDIAKCFDQISRPMVCALTRHLGIPECVIAPWVSFMN